jgi:hypothetical protein
MKKFLSLLVLMTALSSCEEDVKFNNPAVQGFKNNELWKAEDFTATLTDGGTSLTVVGNNGFETLTLHTVAYDAGTYTLGPGSSNTASFEFSADGVTEDYTTNVTDGGGEIVISADPRETDLSKGFITGRFKFFALDSAGNELSFINGYFYKVRFAAAP